MLDKQDLDLFILRCINRGWTTKTLKPKPVSRKWWRLQKKTSIDYDTQVFCLGAEMLRDTRLGRIAV